MNRATCVALAFVFCVSGWAVGQPTLAFNPTSATASGLTPGGAAVWLVVSRERPEWTTEVVRREAIVKDNGGSGVVTFDIEQPVPPNSVWVVVDLSSGEFAVASPPGLNWVPFESPAADQSSAAQIQLIRDHRGVVELLLVRPGVGAWGLSVGDGGESDDGRAPDGAIRVLPASMHPIGASPGPVSLLQRGDVVVAVDPARMEYLAGHFPRSE